MLIAAEVFYNAHVVNDRFHVQQVYNEAVDEIRVDIRRQLIAEDNSRDKSEPPMTYSNGETMRQILARSKHTLMMSQNKWTDIQRHRANILFKHYPILKAAYQLAMELRRIFNLKISPTKALGKMNKWYEKVMALDNNNFRSVIKTFKNHAPTIINYFRRRGHQRLGRGIQLKGQDLPIADAWSKRPRLLHLQTRQTIRLNFNI